MTRIPTPAHLASWAKFAPGINSSAGKIKGNGSTGHGNRYLARVLGEAVAERAGPTLSSGPATDASSADAARRRPSSRSADPYW